MSDPIKHECGVAFIRLRKPLEFYIEKYGTALYGIHKLQFLMTKQLNRGQDGAGLGIVKLDPEFGDRYLARQRSASKTAISDIFAKVAESYATVPEEKRKDAQYLKKHFPYFGELLLGHLRYGTHGGNSLENIHPFLRQNNWMARNLMLAGNYNMTNVDELFVQLIDLGQQPKEKSDNVLMLEKIGHFIDEENQRLFDIFKSQGFTNKDITEKIKTDIQLPGVLKRSFKNIDGGYNMVGLLGHGDAFVIRDPNGIRPSHYYIDDEIIVVASERAAIQTAMNVAAEEVFELAPGAALIVKKDANYAIHQIIEPLEKTACTFERIYFSRGNDAEIYQERKQLGRLLSEKILTIVNGELDNTIFSYVPNTAATAYYGLVEGVAALARKNIAKKLLQSHGAEEQDKLSLEQIQKILEWRPRREKLLVKDVKMRTFITNDNDREDLVGSVYDVTYGVVKPNQDNVVIVDDSIVRGTTLRTSILRILDRLQPKKIILVSSAPQIRYPDCYGIDMSKMGDFVAFQAAIALHKRNGNQSKLEELFAIAKEEVKKPKEQQENLTKKVYEGLTVEEISEQIAELVKPKDLKAELTIVYQSIENLHRACPNHRGDWYFTGNFPTPGGVSVSNRALLNFFEGKNVRAY